MDGAVLGPAALRAPAAVRDAELHGCVQGCAVSTCLTPGDYFFDERHLIRRKSRAFARICKRYICLREKLLPTTTPTTDPISAPATKSENQWMVMETPKPI